MAGTGVLSKGTELKYNSGTSGSPVWTTIPDLQEVPQLGGSPDKVEVTTLADAAKRYIQGIKDYGDLSFKFLYDASTSTSSYRLLKGLEGAVKQYKVVLPDGTSFAFSGEVVVKVDQAGVNAALTFSADIALNSDISVTFAS